LKSGKSKITSHTVLVSCLPPLHSLFVFPNQPLLHSLFPPLFLLRSSIRALQ
jgi:hypothetical protein